MKVLAVLGSPHKNGPTTTITKELLRGAKEAGHEIVEYYVDDMLIKGCKACGYCKEHMVDCIIKDDMIPYWKDFHECGALIVSSPNYCAQITGPMLTFMNRHYCMLKMRPEGNIVRVHPGIKLVGIFSQGAQDPNRYIENYKWYLSDFENKDMLLQDILVHTSAMSYEPGSEIMLRAYELGKSL
ncbi:MAG: flavodoxin family protein [Christensenellaceae bacterium]|nr:flavodoxin family protein [Christensenellaceae bacterium]